MPEGEEGSVPRSERATISCSKEQQKRWKELREKRGVKDHHLVQEALEKLEGEP